MSDAGQPNPREMGPQSTTLYSFPKGGRPPSSWSNRPISDDTLHAGSLFAALHP
jgi:hypothetical protein